MRISRTVARPLLAGVFMSAGIDAVRHPETRAKQADAVARAVASPLGLPDDPVLLVRVNGAVQASAGTLLALGKLPRLSAAALAASLVPTTIAGHPFWEEVDAQKRATQRIHFLKNAAMLGGLVLAATDRHPRNRRRGGRRLRQLALPAVALWRRRSGSGG